MSVISNISSSLTRVIGTTGFRLKQYSPEILTAAGVSGLVASGVLASRASLKLSDILEEKNESLTKIKEVKAAYPEEYPDNVKNSDLVKTYINTGVKLLKLYGPALSLAAVSIVSIISSQGIMRKRNLALVGAYKAIESTFREYRARVAEEIGLDKEEALFYEEFSKEEVVNNKGEKTSVETSRFPGYSPYAKFFDEYSDNWQKDADHNLMFLRTQQAYFNERLLAYGHVFLNEVYDALGIPRTQAGQFVGWVVGNGDSFIDFGIYDPEKGSKEKFESRKAFVNGLEKSILLDFNVDGPIVDLI